MSFPAILLEAFGAQGLLCWQKVPVPSELLEVGTMSKSDCASPSWAPPFPHVLWGPVLSHSQPSSGLHGRTHSSTSVFTLPCTLMSGHWAAAGVGGLGQGQPGLHSLCTPKGGAVGWGALGASSSLCLPMWNLLPLEQISNMGPKSSQLGTQLPWKLWEEERSETPEPTCRPRCFSSSSTCWRWTGWSGRSSTCPCSGTPRPTCPTQWTSLMTCLRASTGSPASRRRWRG